MLIDWECAGIDIPETDIGRVFAGCAFTQNQQDTFLKTYYGDLPKSEIMGRILSVKIVLDFFRIIEDYCISKRKVFNAKGMLHDLEKYIEELGKIRKKMEVLF